MKGIEFGTPFHVIDRLTDSCPQIWKFVNDMAKERFGKHKNNCSQYSFLPTSMYMHFHYLYTKRKTESFDEWRRTDIGGKYSYSTMLAAICPWIYTKQIYEFDDEFVKELVKTPYEGKVPLQVLQKFPNFSIYIKANIDCMEVPNMPNVRCAGFFCCIADRDFAKGSDRTLIFVKHFVDKHKPEDVFVDSVMLPLYGDLDIMGHYDHSEKLHREKLEKIGHDFTVSDKARKDSNNLALDVKKLINIVLYLCSTNLDVVDKTPGVKRHPFKLHWGGRKVSKFQLLAALSPKVFVVGEKIGSQLREEDRLAKASTNPIRPHVRRAHWHGYWTGPRTGERDFILKWIPPTLVGTNNGYVDTVMLG